MKCTIKERRAAARILAARDGLTKINDEIIKRVGSMSDDEIINFLDAEIKPAADAVEVLQPGSVEEITPGADPDDLFGLFSGLVSSYMAANNWDAEKISPLQWAACCLSVGRFVRSRSLFRVEQTNSILKNNINELDIEALTRAAGAWLELCYKYNKTPLICDFCAFVGISKQAFYNLKDADGVNSARLDLFKMIEETQADGLRRRVLNPKESPIGAIFLLKADHGLIEAQKIQHEYIKTSETAAALPVFDLEAIETPENGEKSL